ncbi:MAG: Hydroxyacylglutathione hydrolase [Burkholderiaceae bacterium]|nr:Hydroxyacylglutathione hydrolase [Burkholderiaceae bacterium]
MLPQYVDALGDGLYAIDTGFVRPRFDAAYLIVDHGRAAFVDTGTNHAVPRLLAALRALGLDVDAVDWVIPTHVHLDHAGGAGLLMRSLPRARMAVHPRGQRHMVDPGALHAGAIAVYGEQEVARSYGMPVGVDAARTMVTADGMTIALGQRTLEFIDTPGHARHHHCIWDERTRTWFTGDTFGLAYPELANERGRWVTPTSAPVQFDPEPLKASVARLLARQPAALCVTHFGRVPNARYLGPALASQIDEMAGIAQRLRHAQDRFARLCDALHAMYAHRLAEHGFTDVDAGLALMAADVAINAQGLEAWLDRTA